MEPEIMVYFAITGDVSSDVITESLGILPTSVTVVQSEAESQKTAKKNQEIPLPASK